MASDLFQPRKVIPPDNQRLEILAAENTDAYGPQTAFKLKIVSGEHDGYIFTDYASRDENTGRITEGGKGWEVFQAALGPDFYKGDVGLEDLVGMQIMAKVTQTKTGSRNKLEFGTIGPVPREEEDDQLPLG